MSNLGTKESGLFKTAIQLYEIKQYKRGLKTCEQILAKYPEHGETLALKGLFLLFLDKREEGFDTCKKGLKLSLQSHICNLRPNRPSLTNFLAWHILGLMHRQDKNYEEAIKSYKNALRIDKDNSQILRDLALLQLQCRQLEGAIDTRRKILLSKPSSPFNWMSMIVAYHLSGNLQQALDIFNIYMELFGNIKDTAENNLFYKVSIMLQLGLFIETINFMQIAFKRQDTRRYLESINEAYFSCKMYKLCEETTLKLIDINPDCREYIIKAFELYEIQEKDIGALFDLISEKSLLAAVEMLSLVDVEVFKSKFPSVFKSVMEKGSPASFQLFKEVLKNDERRDFIWQSLVQLDQNNMSILVFKAKYFAFIQNFDSALDLVNASIDSHPNNTDLVMLKAHIQKNMTNIIGASSTISGIKDSIANDKFSVSKTAKYMIRYGSISDAQEIMGKFIQKPNQKERMADLHEMQAVWYLIEMGDRLLKEGSVLNAACFYRKIELIFDEIIDDQLDFHAYSLRRMSFVEYIKFLRFLDNQLKKSEILKRAQIGFSQCLLNLVDIESDIDSLTKKFELSNISNCFEDDVSAHLVYIRSLLSTKKNAMDYLHRICNNLLSHHPEDVDVLHSCLKITLKLGTMLSAQKVAIKILENGGSVPDELVDRIDNYRSSQENSLWQHVTLLN